jgi:hypothetical protein
MLRRHQLTICVLLSGFLAIAVTFALNPVHELGHYVGYTMTRVPACLLFNETVIGSQSTEPLALLGLLGGPVVNLSLGFVFTGTYAYAPSKLKLTCALLVAAMWLLQPVQDIFWLLQLLQTDPDDIRVFYSLRLNHGLYWGALGSVGLFLMPILLLVCFVFRATALPRIQRWFVIIFPIIALFTLFVVIKVFHLWAIPFIGPVGSLCDGVLACRSTQGCIP